MQPRYIYPAEASTHPSRSPLSPLSLLITSSDWLKDLHSLLTCFGPLPLPPVLRPPPCIVSLHPSQLLGNRILSTLFTSCATTSMNHICGGGGGNGSGGGSGGSGGGDIQSLSSGLVSASLCRLHLHTLATDPPLPRLACCVALHLLFFPPPLRSDVRRSACVHAPTCCPNSRACPAREQFKLCGITR